MVVCALALTLVGVSAGLLRHPSYEAAATLQVGQVNPNSPGFFSYVQSSSSLATAFSRAIYAEPVLATVERKLGLPPERAVSRLSSAPIALSPAFRVIANGNSKEEAMSLANVAAKGVIAYEAKSNNANPQAASLLREYQQASTEVRRSGGRVASLKASGASDALLQAEAKTSATKVRQRAIANAYIAEVGSQAPRVGLISLLAGATSATSDRAAKLQLFGFIGLLLGLVLGCLAAVLVERRHLEGRTKGPTQKPFSDPL